MKHAWVLLLCVACDRPECESDGDCDGDGTCEDGKCEDGDEDDDVPGNPDAFRLHCERSNECEEDGDEGRPVDECVAYFDEFFGEMRARSAECDALADAHEDHYACTATRLSCEELEELDPNGVCASERDAAYGGDPVAARRCYFGELEPASCADVLALDPDAESGAYELVLEAGPVDVACDMDFDGGGWTLVLGAPAAGTAGLDVGYSEAGAPARLASEQLIEVAAWARQVHVRSAGAAETRSVTSVAGSPPIDDLRAGERIYATAAEYSADHWTGPFAAVHMTMSCDPAAAVWPDVYQACNNGRGLHVVSDAVTWTGDVDDPDYVDGDFLEVWIR